MFNTMNKLTLETKLKKIFSKEIYFRLRRHASDVQFAVIEQYTVEV